MLKGELYPRSFIIGAAGITGKTQPIYSVCKPYLGMLSFEIAYEIILSKYKEEFQVDLHHDL